MMWNTKKLLLCHLVIFLLLGSFFWPVTKVIWDAVDTGFFRAFNNSLKDHHNWQLFWGLSNHKLADWAHDIVYLSLFLTTIFSVPKEERIKKTAQLFFCLLFVAFVVFVISFFLFRKNLHIPRLSPSLSLSDCVRLSDDIRSWLKIKYVSEKSFPGDHGTSALLFAIIYAYYSTRRLAVIGWIYCSFVCLPRLVFGAHWLSDVVVGSGTIALFSFSWAFYSPFAAKAASSIEWFFNYLGKPFDKVKNTPSSPQK